MWSGIEIADRGQMPPLPSAPIATAAPEQMAEPSVNRQQPCRRHVTLPDFERAQQDRSMARGGNDWLQNWAYPHISAPAASASLPPTPVKALGCVR